MYTQISGWKTTGMTSHAQMDGLKRSQKDLNSTNVQLAKFASHLAIIAYYTIEFQKLQLGNSSIHGFDCAAKLSSMLDFIFG